MKNNGKRWTGKHSLPLKVFEVYCESCGVAYQIEAQTRPAEVWCPFCEDDEPLRVKEVTHGKLT